MPIGAFKLNSIARAGIIAASDAPAIPSVTFTASGVDTTTERSLNGPHSMPFLGVNNNLYAWAANGMSGTSSQRNRQVISDFSATSFAQSIATGTSTQNQVSSSGITTLASANGGMHCSLMGSSTDVRFRFGYVTNWSTQTITNPGTVSAGTISAAQARTSGITASPSVAMAHSPQISLAQHRFGAFWQTGTSVVYASGSQGNNTSGSFSDILFTAPTTLATSVNGGCMDACGFTVPSSPNGQKRFMVGYVGADTQTYNVTVVSLNNSTTNTTTMTYANSSGGVILGASIDSIWDDQPNGKFVGVVFNEVNGNSFLRALKVSSWPTNSTPSATWGTALNIGTWLYKGRAYKTGINGLGVLIYTSSDNKTFYAKFFSVDSNTLDITLGSTEYTLGGTPNAGSIASFGAGTGIDASNRLCIGIQSSDHVASSSNSGWRVYRSTALV